MLKSADLSAATLADIFDQSVDCVKLIGIDGRVQWMNSNGLCAMEIDSIAHVRGRLWAELWPAESRSVIDAALQDAAAGRVARLDAFCPTAKGAPRWWHVTVSPVTDRDGDPAGYLAISRDVTEGELARQALLISAQEMRHRLKNTYAIIGGMINSFARGNAAHEEFARDIQARLVALSTAQALLGSDETPCEISRLIPALVEPFATAQCPIEIGMLPDVRLSAGQADALALSIGELTVNAAKHGAVAHGGKIVIGASDADHPDAIIWDERSHQPVRTQYRDGGQGLGLIERIMRARGGSMTTIWRTEGPLTTLHLAQDQKRVLQ